mgnify:CR=1 FL=1
MKVTSKEALAALYNARDSLSPEDAIAHLDRHSRNDSHANYRDKLAGLSAWLKELSGELDEFVALLDEDLGD